MTPGIQSNTIGTIVFEMDFGERDALGQLAVSASLLISGLAALYFASKKRSVAPDGMSFSSE